MKKKKTIISLISALSCSTFAFAGDMGYDNQGLCVTTFFGLEGGYTNNTIDGLQVDVLNSGIVLSPTKNTKGETVRLSIGVLNKVFEEMALSGEIGWGYYGRTSASTTLINTDFYLSNSYTITGFDALAGISYAQPSFNLFFKAGALIQNMSTNSNINANIFGGIFIDNVAIKNNKTAVLPEIKLGGAYNFNENWALTAAYMHAFGSSVKVTGTIDGTGTLINPQVFDQNPSLNTVLVGIQYTI